MIERFFDIWNKYVIGNKEDFKIGLSQLEAEIRADERRNTIDELMNEVAQIKGISDEDWDLLEQKAEQMKEQK